MTKAQFKAAFTAWRLAIEDQIDNPDKTKSYENLANQYGKSITNQDDLGEVALCFDWDEILDQVEGLTDA